MSDNLWDNAEIKQKVSLAWEKVFAASLQVLSQAEKYGFWGMGVIPDPNIHTMMKSLVYIGVMLDTISGHEELDYDDNRLIINAKEQVTRMELVAATLKANDREEFEKAIGALENQAHF